MSARLRRIAHDIKQVERQAIAIEADVCKSMEGIANSANRFLSARQERLNALRAELTALKGLAVRSKPKRGKRAKNGHVADSVTPDNERYCTGGW